MFVQELVVVIYNEFISRLEIIWEKYGNEGFVKAGNNKMLTKLPFSHYNVIMKSSYYKPSNNNLLIYIHNLYLKFCKKYMKGVTKHLNQFIKDFTNFKRHGKEKC